VRKILCCLLVIACAVALAEDGARLLVITTDALYNSILPLAEWRHATGLSTRVVTLSEVGGSDTASIKNYIREAWSNWPVKPEYVLLVGSSTNLPARYYQRMHGESYASDNIYGDMAGDYQAEIPVGRFPARSAAQLDVMVAKTLGYEKTPPLSDTVWMRRITTVCRDEGDDDGPTYWADLRNAIGLAGSNGFIAADSFASSRGHNYQNVVNSISAGTGLVAYRGSATGNWYTPFDVNPASPTSTGKLPVVLSFTCATMSLNAGESMVGDAWLKAGTTVAPKGGVAFFGNTHSSVNVAQQRSTVCRGFFAGLFTEHKYTLGLACLRGKLQLYQQYQVDTADYRGFNLFGDPTLNVWTGLPRVLTVEHPAEIEPVPQLLHVVVTSAAGPEDSARVCASMDSTVYTYGYTDGSGAIDLSINPANTGSLRLVVTGHNLYPYDTVIAVTNLGIEERTPLPCAGPVTLTAAPAVFNRTAKISWDARLSGSTVNVFDATGRPVTTLRTTGSEVVWQAADMQAGAYICVLTDPRGRALARTKVLKLE
jgi:hypothetical protein